MTTTSDQRTTRGRRASRPSGDDREQAILATARRLIADRTFAEISVDDLAKGAGLSRPTFYFYFPSKEALILTLLEPLIQRADAGFNDAASLPTAPRLAFHAGIATFFNAFAAEPALTRAGVEAMSSNTEVRAVWTQFMQKWIDQTTALIIAERERGAAPNTLPAKDLATTLNQMNERAMTAAIAGEPGAVDPDHIIETLSHIWLTSIYGTPP